jgi:hypothetical protein
MAETNEYAVKVIATDPYRVNGRTTVLSNGKPMTKDVLAGPTVIVASGTKVDVDHTEPVFVP